MENVAALALPFAQVSRLAATLDHIGGMDLHPVHYIADNIYARELSLPAGSLAIGHIHRERHICTCSKGSAIVYSVDAPVRHVEAPHTWISEPGTQRVVFCVTDVVWTSYHVIDGAAVDVSDPASIEVLEATIYEKREFPSYVEGDAAMVIAWLAAVGRIPLPGHFTAELEEEPK